MKTHIWVGDGVLSLDCVGLEQRERERERDSQSAWDVAGPQLASH